MLQKCCLFLVHVNYCITNVNKWNLSVTNVWYYITYKCNTASDIVLFFLGYWNAHDFVLVTQSVKHITTHNHSDSSERISYCSKKVHSFCILKIDWGRWNASKTLLASHFAFLYLYCRACQNSHNKPIWRIRLCWSISISS